MKMVKALLLGAAAGLAGVAGAQAADLPGKAAPASYVKICDTYGAGYYFIPGSETCLKIGGFVRLHAGTGTVANSSQDSVQFHSRFVLNVDARARTEYGLLRSYGELTLRRGYGTGASYGITGQAPDSSLAVLTAAFIQFGPLTAGFAPSFFNFYNGLAFVEGVGAGLAPSTTLTNLLAFTASFGGGFAATLSVEDRNLREQGAQSALAAGALTTAAANSAATGAVLYSGQVIPDVVLALRVDQAWGSAQLMGALHHINVAAAAAAPTGPALNRLGWAIGAGVRLNLDSFAKGDTFWLQGVITNGAVNYAFNGTNTADGIPSNGALGVNLVTARYADAAYAPADPSGTGIAATTAFSVFGGFQHFFTPAVRGALWGGYVNVDATGGATLSDFDFFIVGANVLYSPVRNLDLGLEAGYKGANVRTPAGAAVGNDGAWFTTLRVQRNF